ncbi:MAG: hypothetical protein GYB68_16315 [Chloroflexi bacterium]|nr:hypothetical protein [Chloroflexota bacterium]
MAEDTIKRYTANADIKKRRIRGFNLTSLGLIILSFFASRLLGNVIIPLFEGEQTPTELVDWVNLALIVAVLVVWAVFFLYYVLVASPSFLSVLSTYYLELNEDGLFYNFHPVYSVAAYWADVESFELDEKTERLILRNGERGGWGYLRVLRRWLGFDDDRLIVPLHPFQEWPDGELAADLRQYAPHILRQRSRQQRAAEAQAD